MNVFYVVSGKKLKQYFLIALALVLGLGVIYSERESFTVFSQSEPAAIYSVKTDRKMLALTFDISWGEHRMEPIVKLLEDNGVKATFFLSSPWSQTHPELVQRIVKGGFEIGSHGHKHVNYSSLNEDEIRQQITRAHGILSEVVGASPSLIRLPNGDFDKRVLRIANELNYTVIQWHTDSLDWENPGVHNIVRRVVSNAHPGDIILMHASDSSKQTHEALPEIIRSLREEGYEFVTVSELIHQTQIQHTPVEDQTFSTH